MGLFDFLKDKGEKLIEGDEQEALAKAKKEDPEITTLERMKARALRNLVLGKGMKIEGFELVFDDGVVTVEGTAVSQERPGNPAGGRPARGRRPRARPGTGGDPLHGSVGRHALEDRQGPLR